MIKLDYSIESPEERKKLVEQIVAENDDLSPGYLEILANYLIMCMEKQEKKERQILTDNRLMTVNKRECSFEGIVSQLENGEDGIYNLISDNKHILLQPKISITKKDLEEIPFLRQLRDTIDLWVEESKTATGKNAYLMKKAIIEMRKDQYVIKQAYQKPIHFSKITKTTNLNYIKLEDKSRLDNNNDLIIEGVTFMDSRIVETTLCNYSRIKQEGEGNFNSDLWYYIESFDALCEKALQDYPIYRQIVISKIDGLQNSEIQKILEQQYGVKHSLEYISSLWRNKIPKIISQVAIEDFLIQEYQQQQKPMKRCSRCGQYKPAHNTFFSKNKTSKDGFYSICKSCRNKKRG